MTTFVLGFAVSSFQDGSRRPSSARTSSTTETLAARVCGRPASNAGPSTAVLRAPEDRSLPGGRDTPKPDSGVLRGHPGRSSEGPRARSWRRSRSHATTRTTPAYSPSAPSVLSSPTTPDDRRLGLPRVVQAVARASVDGRRPAPARAVHAVGGQVHRSTRTPSDPTKGDDFALEPQLEHRQRADVHRVAAGRYGSGVPAVDATATIRPYVTTTVGDGLGKYSATPYTALRATSYRTSRPRRSGSSQPCPYTLGDDARSGEPGLDARRAARRWSSTTRSRSPRSARQPRRLPLRVARTARALGGHLPRGARRRRPPRVAPSGAGRTPAFSPSGRRARRSSTWRRTTDCSTPSGRTRAKQENNERWAMLPPAVMPNLRSSYPSSHELLLDGSPVVKDVAWDRTIATAGDPTLWHTMLVAGFGASNQGYYAVDVTNPDASKLKTGVLSLNRPGRSVLPVAAHEDAGEELSDLRRALRERRRSRRSSWTRKTATARARSASPSSPAARTARRRRRPATGPRVRDSQRPRTPRRSTATRTGRTSAAGDRRRRAPIPVNGRSLAVVRVDTGEILQVFARKTDVQKYPTDTLLIAGRIRDTPLDSPMTGTPLVFPNDVGSDTTKVFVPDADGTIWRFDLSNPDPLQWTGELYLDLYNQTVDTNATSWSDGQPLQVPPALSLDTSGELVSTRRAARPTASTRRVSTSSIRSPRRCRARRPSFAPS